MTAVERGLGHPGIVANPRRIFRFLSKGLRSMLMTILRALLELKK